MAQQQHFGEPSGSGFDQLVTQRRGSQDELVSQDKLDSVRIQAFGSKGTGTFNVEGSPLAYAYKPASLSDAPPRLNQEQTSGYNPFLRFGPPPAEGRKEQTKTAELPQFGTVEFAQNDAQGQKAVYKQLMNRAISDFTQESENTTCKVSHAFPENATQITMTRPDFSSKVLERSNDGDVTVTDKCPKGHPRTVTQLSEHGWMQTQIAYEKNAQGKELPWKSSELVSTSEGVSKEIVYKHGAIREVRDAPFKPLTV